MVMDLFANGRGSSGQNLNCSGMKDTSLVSNLMHMVKFKKFFLIFP